MEVYEVIFGCEANTAVGAGHIMRCLSYAIALEELGIRSAFFGHNDLVWLQDTLSKHKFAIASSEDQCQILIVDSYELNFIEEVKKKVTHTRLVQIVDPSTPVIENDGIFWLDPYPPSESLVVSHRILAQGLSLMPSRNRKVQVIESASINRVLVTLGGSPTQSHIEALLKTTRNPIFNDVTFNCFFPKPSHINVGENHIFFDIGPRLDLILKSCGVVISGCGTSIWDFLGARKLVGAINLIKNQERNYRFVTSKTLALGLGDMCENIVVNADLLFRLLSDVELQSVLLENIDDCIDDSGPMRLAKKLLVEFQVT